MDGVKRDSIPRKGRKINASLTTRVHNKENATKRNTTKIRMVSETMDIEDEGYPHPMRDNRRNINIQRNERCQCRLIVGAKEESFSTSKMPSTQHYYRTLIVQIQFGRNGRRENESARLWIGLALCLLEGITTRRE